MSNKVSREYFYTDQLDQFKLSKDANRPISHGLVDKLVKSINRNNLLEYCPIQVNEHLEITDGQHRWLAAKKIGVGIWFMIIPSKAQTWLDVALMNLNQEKWTTMDFVYAWVNQGSIHHRVILDLVDKYGNFGLTLCQSLVSTKSIKGNLSDIKRVSNNIDFVIELAETIKDLRENSDIGSMFIKQSVIGALTRVWLRSDIDHTRLINIAKGKRSDEFRTTAPKKSILLEWQDIYNFGLNKSSRIYDFLRPPTNKLN